MLSFVSLPSHFDHARLVDIACRRIEALGLDCAAGVTFHKGVVNGAEHAEGISSVQCEDGTAVRSSIVLDATGHTRKLIHFSKGKKFDPGFQGAYGITAKVCWLVMFGLCHR